MIAENGGRDLAAGIAIDAGGVHVELSRHVLRQTLRGAGHNPSFRLPEADRKACRGSSLR
jgi:hypothetical protein